MNWKWNVLIISVLTLTLAYTLHDPLPDEPFSNRSYLYTQMAVMKLVGIMTDICQSMGCDAPIFYRNTVHSLLHIFPTYYDPNVTRSDEHFDGVPVRVYKPKGAVQSPTRGIVFYHGGGFVIGDLDTYDHLVSRLCKDLRAVVVSVDYRLAPEHLFPAAVEDCHAAAVYFLTNAQAYGVDPTRIALMGDSGGGNLAAGVSIRLRDSGFNPMPKIQILLYPALQAVNIDTPSYRANKYGPFVTKWRAAFFLSLYLFGENYTDYIHKIYNNHYTSLTFKKAMQTSWMNTDNLPKDSFTDGYQLETSDTPEIWRIVQDRLTNSDFSPLMAKDLSGLPETYMSTCQYDVVRDDGYFYAQRQREAGVRVHHVNLYVCVHGWVLSHHDIDTFAEEFVNLVEYIDSKL